MSHVARRVLGALGLVLASGGCLDDTPVTAGSPTVRAMLNANVVGVIAGGTVRIRVGYRTSRQAFVALPSSPEQIDVAPATTVVLPLTVDIGPCLADSERMSGGEPGCKLVIELTLSDASGGVIDSQTREATGAPAMPGDAVNFGSVTIGVSVSTLVVTPSPVNLTVSQEQLLTATVRDAAGAIVTSVPVSWTTTDATVAQLTSSSGASVTVRALKLGSATIAASAGGRTNQVLVNVVPPLPLTIRQREGAGCVIVGQTITLDVDSPPGPISWSSANASTATVGAASGIVTGIAAGQVVITATSGNRTGTATVCVTGPLRVSPTSLSITAARTGQITATGVTGGVVSYASSATGIATVDANGLVRGLTVGQAVITATFTAPSGTQTATASVAVTAGGISITPTSGSAALTRTARFTAMVQDANGATLPGVAATWTIDDGSVGSLSAASGAVVDVRALKVGSTIVRASAGGASASAQFTATQPLPASRLEKVSGDGAVCATFSTGCTFVVRALDATGAPVPGASIAWSGPFGCPSGPVTTSDADGLATASNVCSEVVPGLYTQTAALSTSQQQAVFTYTLNGLTLTSSSDFEAIRITVGSSTATAEGLATTVRYRSGPVSNYFTSMQLNRTFAPATLTLGLNMFQLPFGSYTFDVTATTTTPGVGPAIRTFGFVVDFTSGFVQPKVFPVAMPSGARSER